MILFGVATKKDFDCRNFGVARFERKKERKKRERERERKLSLVFFEPKQFFEESKKSQNLKRHFFWAIFVQFLLFFFSPLHTCQFLLFSFFLFCFCCFLSFFFVFVFCFYFLFCFFLEGWNGKKGLSGPFLGHLVLTFERQSMVLFFFTQSQSFCLVNENTQTKKQNSNLVLLLSSPGTHINKIEIEYC